MPTLAAYRLTVGEMPAHGHEVAINALGAHFHSFNTNKPYNNSIWSNDPSLISLSNSAPGIRQHNTSSSGAYTPAASVNTSGGNELHNNMQPFTVALLWQRTA